MTISSSSENGTIFHEVNFFLENTVVAEIQLAGGTCKLSCKIPTVNLHHSKQQL